jgi:hypothetical protein
MLPYKPALSNQKKEPEPPQARKEVDSRQDALTFQGIKLRNEIDEKLGFPRFLEGNERLGWLVNIQEVN